MPYVTPDSVREPLYAIVPYFNPWRWKSREKHTARAIKHFADSGAVIVLIEAAFNRRELAFADSGLEGALATCNVIGAGFRHKYIGLRTKDELWLKENLINLAVAQLPYDWQNVCWLDSDVHFLRPNWVGECIHKLQHYAFLQMFSHARDVGPNYEVMPEDYPHADGIGFIHHHITTSISRPVTGTLTETAQGDRVSIKLDLETTPVPYGAARVWPGLAWACTREAWDAVGGLIDFAAWGGADWHMSHALVETEDIDTMMRADLNQNYRNMVLEWRERCCTKIRRNVGVMSGSIFHYWHGPKTQRGYTAKHRLLSQTQFDPTRHLKRDYQGLYQLHDDGSEAFIALRDMQRQIARERNEDSSDTRLDLWGQGH